MSVELPFLEGVDDAGEPTTVFGSYAVVRFSVGTSSIHPADQPFKNSHVVYVDTDALLDAHAAAQPKPPARRAGVTP
jgi:hypothetical protein